MKKEILKGFSLLAVIIVLALMTAVASTNALSMTKAEANVRDVTASDTRAQVSQY
ncbi:MAG: hypothetical protein ACR2H4_18175 [Pyrinomonadaceae bacterium]|jgi:type II secretory pathway component PulK